jgi:hypothetical protein
VQGVGWPVTVTDTSTGSGKVFVSVLEEGPVSETLTGLGTMTVLLGRDIASDGFALSPLEDKENVTIFCLFSSTISSFSAQLN